MNLPNHPIKMTLKNIFFASFIVGLISLVWLLLIPGNPGNSVLLGMSTLRLILFFVLLIALCGSAFTALRARQNPAWSQGMTQKISQSLLNEGNLTTVLVFSLAGFSSGIYFLYTAFTTTDLFLQGYFTRLAPIIFWLTATLLGILLYVVRNSDFRGFLRSHGAAILILLIILTAGMLMHNHLWQLEPEDWDTYNMFNRDNKFALEEQDIYAIFSEGDRIQQGINPYARSLDFEDSIEWNQVFATYLPISYIFAWLTQEIGLEGFLEWLGFWRVVFLMANLGIGYLIFYIPYYRHNNLVFAALASLFWFFNRWTLHMTMIYHIDFIAIFFLLLSLVTWPKNKIISLLAFGLSLGVKHIAIFMIPLYAIWIWQAAEKKHPFRQFILLSLVTASIPLIFSSPFLALNAKAFFKSIFVSATRISESHFGAPSIDTLLGLTGIPAKLPMLGLMGITFLGAWKKRIKLFAAALFIIIIFIDFNSVLFRQYMTWVSPLVLLALCETFISPKKNETPPIA
jgi:hypothetical protein